jgi:hypothetical protein
MTDGDLEAATPRRTKRMRLRPLILGLVVGMLAAGILALIVLFFLVRGTTPLVTEAALAAASERWQQRGPKSYRLELMVSGARGGPVEIEVRDGEPVSLLRDGRTPARHTWYFWTVPGQLEAIELELTGDPRAMFGVPDRSHVILRAEFDAELGYPRKYQRQVLGKSLETGWEVHRFQPLD